MAGLTVILGIFLFIKALGTPRNKNIVSGITATILIAVTVLFALFAFWIVIKTPVKSPEMIGQAAGHVIILIFFVALGAGIRKARLAVAKKKAT
jgi:cell division protein FtsN